MGAVAKRILGLCAATTERHPRFYREFIAIAVDQFDFALHDIRTVLDCLDCYHVSSLAEVDRVVPNAMRNKAPLCGGRINIVFGEADPPHSSAFTPPGFNP